MDKKELFADLHIHSRFSRACSRDLNLANLVKWARVKGIGLLGTGDFTHPEWLKELKENLKEENGIFWFSDDKGRFPFILSSEISLVYTDNGKGRRVHLVYLAPSFEAVDKINLFLDKKGRRDYDGRPIFKISCRDFAAEMENIDDKIEIIPAHCLLPGQFIHTNNSIKKIENLKVGDRVLTHNNRLRKIKEVLVNDYSGTIYKIRPWYFSVGTSVTPEHLFFAIKSYKSCKSTKGLCKPLCSSVKNCKKKYYLNYKAEWILAKNLEKGDFLVYPRFNQESDIEKIDITKFIRHYKNLDEEFILPAKSKNHRNKIKRFVKVDKNFCRLIGYYLSEGYTIGNEAIGFSFHSKERDYINEVITYMGDYFGVTNYKIDSRGDNQRDIIFFSSIINDFFSNFYLDCKKRALNKIIPKEFLLLKKEKLAEILRGWWRGDLGYSISRELINQIKLICLKLSIIPSISVSYSLSYNKKKHYINRREIKSDKDLFCMNLSFFEDDYDMLKEKCFKRSVNKLNRKHGWIDENYIYIPIRIIEVSNYSGEVYNLEVEEDNSYVTEFSTVHNCWTPWFGIFGSKGGYDSLGEAFKDKIYRIHAIETGISSDPAMNWKIKELGDRNISIVSFSDLHSYWPWRLGREATIFNLEEGKKLNYDLILEQIRENNFSGTIETDPAYGKYHYDGHANCGFSSPPSETKKIKGICPVCKKPLTIGVDYRVDELSSLGIADYFGKKKYYTILPLHEIISLALGIRVSSKGCWNVYNPLIEKFGNEFEILLNASREKIAEAVKNELLVDLILRNRLGNIKIKPGYDGIYGVPLIGKVEKQGKLF